MRVATLAISENSAPDWEAGHQWIDTVPADFLRNCQEDRYGRRGASDKEIADRVHRMVEELKALLTQPPRTVDWFHVRGARVYITGWLSTTGTEDPPAPYALINSLECFNDWDLETGSYRRHGSLIGALGFDD